MKLLLIAGAARSGTTVLSNLLDSHSNIVCFPFEDDVLDCYYRKNIRDKSFYLNDFISNRKYGQQTIIFNKNLLESYKEKIFFIYGKTFELNIDFQKAKDGYFSYLKSNKLSLENIYKALGYAIINSCDYYIKRKSKIKYFCFKRPSWVDFYIPTVLSDIDSLKCLWIIRDPFSRYVSAKTRRLNSYNKLSHINRYDYLLGHTLVDLVTQDLFQKNKSNKRIYRVNFNQLIQTPGSTFENIFSFLEIKKERCFELATRLGVPSEAGSSISNVKKGVVNKKSNERKKQYLKITSWNERIIHDYFLNREYSNHNIKKIIISILYLIPLRKGNLKNYFYQISTIFLIWFRKESFVQDFMIAFRDEKANLSGEI